MNWHSASRDNTPLEYCESYYKVVMYHSGNLLSADQIKDYHAIPEILDIVVGCYYLK